MRLTKTTSHAIRILFDCAAAGERRVKAAQMAECLDIGGRNIQDREQAVACRIQ
jgi:DNA-binding IscR family transcriptional regulator